jgi:hypothetical protein
MEERLVCNDPEVIDVKGLDLDQIERSVFRHYLQDGLFDILMGVYFLFVGLALPSGPVAVFVVLPIFVFVPLMRWLKKRVTYPRAGFVELREGDPQPVPYFVLGSFALGLVVLVIVLVGLGVIGDPALWYRWMPILFGTGISGMLLGLGLRVGLPRYYVEAGVALIGGPIATLPVLSEKLGNLGLFFAAIGALVLIGGILTLVRFILQHPPVVTENDDVLG